MNIKTIVTIDPGKSGGISIFSNGRIQAVKMPQDVSQMNEYFSFLKETYDGIIVFIEKVQAFSSDDDAPGKKFAINKMLANYTQLLTVLQLTGFTFVEVYPISWQTSLGLKIKKDKRSKTERKRSYKEYAQNCFPEIKVNLSTCDALCLVQFALLKMKNDVSWITSRLQNVPKQKLI